MIWTIIIIVVAGIIIKFLIDLNKDNYDLQGGTISDKFKLLIHILNDAAFGGHGQISITDKRRCNLYKEGSNQIIILNYGTGILTITWRYKYFHKEVVHEKQFNDVRNISSFDQQKIANQMVMEMNHIIENHQKSVLKDI